MNCPDENAFALLLESRLPAAAQAELDAHLDGCAPCRLLLASLGRVAQPSEEWTFGNGVTAPAWEEAVHPGASIGRYVLGDEIGSGGMGVVYAAHDPELDRKVAIKVLRKSTDPDAVARFRLEARAASAVGHPGIVDVIDFATTPEGVAYIVMEYLNGETLAKRMARSGPLAAEVVKTIGMGLFDAIGAAHDKGIVHRDLKPENVFLQEKDPKRLKVLDFGVHKRLSAEGLSLTRTGTVMGTPLYMSPEQARGAKDVGVATDLHAIGAILYHALAGQPPFSGDNYNEVMAKVLLEAPPSLRARRPDVPAALCTLIQSLLEKAPSARPKDARTCKAVLEGSRAQPLGPLHRGRRRAVGLAGLLAITAAVGAYALASRSTPGPPLSVAVTRPSLAAPPRPEQAAAATAPATNVVTLRADPRDARWSIDGRRLDCNPCDVPGAPGARSRAVARAPGFRDAPVEVSFDETRSYAVRMTRTVPRSPAPKRNTAPAQADVIDTANPYRP